jgi:hypothetical protein
MRKLIVISLILPLLYCPIGCSKGNKDTTKTDQQPKKAAEEKFEIDRSDFDPFAKTFARAITNGNKAAYQEVLPNPNYASDILEGLEGANVTNIKVYQDTLRKKSYEVFFDNGRSLVIATYLWQGKISVNVINQY